MKKKSKRTPRTPEIVFFNVNTGGLLSEIANNTNQPILLKPIQIFRNLLGMVGERAAELNDPELNGLMCQLAIYSIADGYSPDYDHDRSQKVMKTGHDLREARLKEITAKV